MLGVLTAGRCVLPALVAMAWACASANAQPQSRPSPAEPSPPHEKLAFFEGTWMAADSASVRGFRESCAWLPEGRRHMVCRSRWNTSAGPREGLSILSYDGVSGEYVYNGFRPGGAHVGQRGREENGRWTFSSELGQAGERTRQRVTIEADGRGGFTLLTEVARGDGAWQEQARDVFRRSER
jgi:hypothetical protein